MWLCANQQYYLHCPTSDIHSCRYVLDECDNMLVEEASVDGLESKPKINEYPADP